VIIRIRVVMTEMGSGERRGTLTATRSDDRATRIGAALDATGRPVVTVESATMDPGAVWKRANEELDRLASERTRRKLVRAIVKLRPEARLGSAVRTARRSGGRARGQQLAADATKHDATIRKYHRQWQQSDELQDEYRSAVAFIRTKTNLATRTIQRAIRRLNRDSS
jgi:hypothetical protein